MVTTAPLASPQVARRVPRPQSLLVESSGAQVVAPTDLGVIRVADAVVAKLSSRVALEVADVGSAATRVLGKEVAGGGLGRLGLKQSQLGALPSCSAQVDGQLAFVQLTISVRYPVSVRRVAAAVREHVAARVGSMTGLQVMEVDITVPALVRDDPLSPRVL